MIIRLAILVSLLLFPQTNSQGGYDPGLWDSYVYARSPVQRGWVHVYQSPRKQRIIGTTLNSNRYLNLVGAPVGSNVTVRLAGTVPFDLNSVVIRGFGVARKLGDRCLKRLDVQFAKRHSRRDTRFYCASRLVEPELCRPDS